MVAWRSCEVNRCNMLGKFIVGKRSAVRPTVLAICRTGSCFGSSSMIGQVWNLDCQLRTASVMSLSSGIRACDCFLIVDSSDWHRSLGGHDVGSDSRVVKTCLQAVLSLSSAIPFRAPQYMSTVARSLSNVASLETEEEDFSSVEENMRTAVKERRTEDAWHMYQILRKQGLLPSEVCTSRLVAQLCHMGKSSSLSRAQKVMAELQKDKRVDLLDSDSIGLLIMASARAGAARYSLSILRLMLELGNIPPVKVWSAVVSRLGNNHYDAPLAVEVFHEICMKLTEDEDGNLGGRDAPPTINGGELIPRTNSYSSLKSSQARKRICVTAMQARPDSGAFNAALNACATSGLVEAAEKLLQQMSIFEVVPDTFTFNILIKLYGKAKQPERLDKLSEQMNALGIEPDLSTFNSLVSVYVSLGLVDKAERLVETMQKGQTGWPLESKPNGSVQSDGNIVATTDLNGASMSRVKPDVRTYTTLMKGYVKSNRVKDAIQLLVAMQNQQHVQDQPNEVTYTTAVAACVRMGLMEEARSILAEMASQKVPANVITYNTLLKGYCRNNQLSKAFTLMDNMKKNRIACDVVSYNTVINGCIQADDNLGALELFKEMKADGIAPTEVSYTTLMKALRKNGQPRLVSEVFDEMLQDPWIRTDSIAWNVLIDSYCRAGQMEEAKVKLGKMKDSGFLPTVATYDSLVKGFARTGKAGDALVLWKEISERIMATKGDVIEPLEPDERLLDSLVDICVRAGYFQRALEVVACMEQQAIPADKTKYKRMFIELYSNLYTSVHASARRRQKSVEKRHAVDAFKFWLGLPNNYYETDWSP